MDKEELKLDAMFNLKNIYFPCIYFLYQDKEVVYVGQTMMGLKRVLNHFPEKKFDSVGLMRCEVEKLNEVETYYIAKFKPIYNKALTNTQSAKCIKSRLKNIDVRVRINKIREWIEENIKSYYEYNDELYVSEEDAVKCINYFANL